MNTTELGTEWDVSWSPDLSKDVILLDSGDDAVYLTRSDLLQMLEYTDE
jgi:hypothetical protein